MRHDQLDLQRIDIDYLAYMLEQLIDDKTSQHVKPVVTVEEAFVGRPTVKQQELVVSFTVLGTETGPLIGISNIYRLLVDGLDYVAEGAVKTLHDKYIRNQ